MNVPITAATYNLAIVFIIRKRIVDWITDVSNLSENLVKRNASRLNWFQYYKNKLYTYKQIHSKVKVIFEFLHIIADSFIYQ